ncbi:MAG TPA: hypothetical protein PKE31_13505 [Pseudomonadota bacterium]|jgi:hypothetical protein|nr:hypothetical protein [Pseudomonadota bacterium]
MKEALGLFLGVGLATSYVLLLRVNTHLYAQAGRQGLALALHVIRLVVLIGVMVLLGMFGKRFLLAGLVGFVPTHLLLYVWLRRQSDDLAAP